MSKAEQATLTECVAERRERCLLWTPDNPNCGPDKPQPYTPTVRRYLDDPDSLPYDVPTEGSKDGARAQHRTWYWLEHSFARFVCPDCERPVDEVKDVDLHHIDENPHNGAPENLVALCRRCHGARHGGGLTISGLSVDEWKDEFLNHGEEA